MSDDPQGPHDQEIGMVRAISMINTVSNSQHSRP